VAKGKYGFVALWKHSDTWYAAGPEEKKRLTDRVNEINREAQKKGIVMSSVYDCAWSSEWHYFSFWECPDLEVLEETIEKLEECGDINVYNIQHHYAGKAVPDNMLIDRFKPEP
jgi:hypothetical protein